jgi:hypothetical protein
MTPVLDRPGGSDQLPPPSPDARPVGESQAAQPPPTAPAPTPAEPRPGRSGWHIAAIVVGAIMLLPGFGALAGGTGLLIAQSTADDGFFDVTLDRVESTGVAVTTVDLWAESADDEGWPWVLDWLDVDVRLRVDGARTTEDVFVGIARSEDIRAYLAGTRHSEVTGFDDRTPDYRQIRGTTSVEAPVDVDFWDASATGTGEQTLTWEAQGGDWSVVVMNADGSADVAADVEVGIHSDAITPIGITMLVVGGLVVIAGTVLIVIGARGRRTT